MKEGSAPFIRPGGGRKPAFPTGHGPKAAAQCCHRLVVRSERPDNSAAATGFLMFPRLTKILPLLALAAGLLIGPAFAAPAFAADGPYTVSDVHVDASAASPAEALNAAMAQGRPKGWQILYRRLTRQQDWTRQPELDGAALIRILRDSSIANERRSTTRYVAD